MNVINKIALSSGILVSTAFLSLGASAEVTLPYEPSEDLTAAQISENLQVLSTAINESQAEIESLKTVTNVPVLQRLAADNDVIVTLHTQGDLSVKAKCGYQNGSEPSSGRALTVWSESNVLGSLMSNRETAGYYPEVEVGRYASLWGAVVTSSADETQWKTRNDQGITVSAAGDVIAIDGETFGYGINVQGSECLIVGNIIAYKGDAAPESFDPSTALPE